MIELPLTSDSAQAFTCQLGAQKFYFEITYNSRNGTWALSMADDATREPIITGAPIVLGADLLDPYNLPYGALVAQDKTGQGRDAGPDDLGDRVVLHWVAPDEVLP